MKSLAHFAPWLSRVALAAASLVLVMIAGKYIADPVGAAAVSKTNLGSPLAVTDMRASFGAFPLGCALIALGSLTSRRFHLAGLMTVAAVMGSALVVRLVGSLVDGTFAESRTLLLAETVLFSLAFVAITAELSRRSSVAQVQRNKVVG